MDAVGEFFFWLDGAPWRFWVPAWMCLGVCGVLALRPMRAPSGQAGHAGWFVAAVVLTLFAFRWPTWFYRLDLNHDEAQIVAGALTLDRFPLPWKHLDPTTHGPLCEYFLIFASWLGAPFNYVTARIMAALLQGGSLLAVWASLRLLAGETAGRVAVLPGLVFWCLTPWDDFLHYSSELPGIFLMAWGGFFLTRLLLPTDSSRSPTATSLLAGLCLGLVPYAKLQSMPQAGLMGLIGLVLLWRNTDLRPHRGRLIATLVFGALLPTLLHGLYLTVFGLWQQFWLTYVVSALDYLANSDTALADMPARFLHFSATSASFAWFLWGNLGFALLYLRSAGRPLELRIGLAVGWALLATAWFTVLRPGRETVHYLHLLVIPLTTLTGLTLAQPLQDRINHEWRERWQALGLCFLLGLLPQFLNQAVSYHRFVGHARTHWEAAPSAPAAHLLARAAPGDTLAMWGWTPHLHVETQLPHGTREAHSASQIIQWPLTPFYVDRYLGDLERRRPVWFVDAVGPGAFVFENRAQHAHESVPALRAWIAENYDFEAEIGFMRLYRLKGVERPMTTTGRP